MTGRYVRYASDILKAGNGFMKAVNEINNQLNRKIALAVIAAARLFL